MDPNGHRIACDSPDECATVAHVEESNARGYIAQQAQLDATNEQILAQLERDAGANQVGRLVHRSPGDVLAGTLYCDQFGLSAKDCATLLSGGYEQNQSQTKRSPCPFYGQSFFGSAADAETGGLPPGCYFTAPASISGLNGKALLQALPLVLLSLLPGGEVADLGEGALSSAGQEATFVASRLLRAGGGRVPPARLPMNLETVHSIADQYGIELSQDPEINKALMGISGETRADATYYLTRTAFSSPDELAKTLFEEEYHVAQVLARGYPANSTEFATYEGEAEAALNEWWASHPLNPSGG